MDELVPVKPRATQMSNKDKPLQSGSAAVVFFTTLSSMGALAAALLPFVIR